MTTRTATLSRRTTLLAGVGLALGAASARSFAQAPAAAWRVPETEAHWANLGVALKGKTALVTVSTGTARSPRITHQPSAVRRTLMLMSVPS